MKPESQRIAIAEACGWKRVWWNGGDSIPFGDNPRGNQSTRSYDHLPDYLNDLNAMHEAEKALRGVQWLDYVNNLKRILCDDPVVLVAATAAQRAEAFLRTLNLWVA